MSDPLQEARRLSEVKERLTGSRRLLGHALSCPALHDGSCSCGAQEAADDLAFLFALAQRVEDAGTTIDELCDALFWISEYPNRVTPDEGQEEHAVELAEHARNALSLHDESRQALRQER